MKLSRLLFLVLTIGFFQLSQAQDQLECGQVEMTRQLLKEDPSVLEKMEKTDAIVRKYSPTTEENFQKDDNVLVIPVVFHIVYSDNFSNISDEQVISAIDYLNEVYRKDNGDSAQIASQFQGIHADMGIEFRLATLDPNGACTNGIMRYEDPRSASSEGNELKRGRQWPAAKYLNIYTVRRFSNPGLGGFAYIPGTVGPNDDGIMVLSRTVGTVGTSNRFSAATLAHEVGHYLGLYHTWGKSNDPALPSNCDDDDEVADTPNTVGNRSCNLNATSCGSLDNVQNYMEYAGCYPEMFTVGQRNRIFGFINANVANRGNLMSKANNEATGTDYPKGDFPKEICRVDFKLDLGQSEACLGVPVQFRDNSLFDIVSWEWSFPGGDPAMSTSENPKVTYNAPGTYDVTLKVTNSLGDTETMTRTGAVSIVDHPQLDYPVVEKFDNYEIFDISPFGWYSVNNPDNDMFWELTEFAGYDDGICATIQGFYQLDDDGLIDEMTSLGYVLPNTGTVSLSFYYAHAYTGANQEDDILEILVSTDCGASFSTLDVLTGDELETAEGFVPEEYFQPQNSEWKLYNFDLTQYVGQTINLKFRYTHNGGNNFFIDNLTLSGTNAISENATNGSQIFPNPASVGSQVRITNQTAIEELEVYNTLGARINAKVSIVGKEANLETNNLAPGVYTLIVNGTSSKSIQRFIIK